MRLITAWFCLICPVCPILAMAAPQDPSLRTPDSFPRFAPVEPAEVAKTFVVQDGFEMQLIAAEPLVTDPVAMAIDENGLAFVVEMNDYPYTDAKTHKAWQDNTTDSALGRVRILEDTDNDGRYDRSFAFADGLSWPSGLCCYQGGVFVTATPDVWYLKDTDGDRKADVREKVFSGFRKYNVQAVMNNPIWGLDNKIYVAGSSNGGSVVVPGTTQAKPIVARGDFRFDPRTKQLELQAGGARFGNAFDDWGNRYLCNIRNPAIHVVLDNSYLGRNPYFAAPTAIFNIAEAGDQMPVYRISPIEPWRELRGRQWSADPTKKLPRSELTGGGVFTSTSGINVYRGDAYPKKYDGQLFVAEVANNVIYRQTHVEDGNTFRAERADANVEFVASTDTWFRPVNLVNAPDGTLYVLDMYREFIEHPWSIPDDIHERLDLRSGSDRGRIYRLKPPHWKLVPFEALGKLSSEQLVTKLSSPRAWVRETAQRLLVERNDKTVRPGLDNLLSSDSERAVIHALWTLKGLDLLSPQQVVAALSNDSPHVVEQAIKLAEPLLKENKNVMDAVAMRINHRAPRVRLQAALSLGNEDGDRNLELLSELAERDGNDSWMRAAVCSAHPQLVPQILLRLLHRPYVEGHSIEPLIDALVQTSAGIHQKMQSMPVDLRDQNPSSLLPILLSAHAGSENSIGRRMEDQLWLSLFQFSRRKGLSLGNFFDEHDRRKIDASKLFTAAKVASLEDGGPLENRKAHVVRLTLGSEEEGTASLMSTLDQTSDSSIATLAIQALGTYNAKFVGPRLIDRLKRLTPAVRDEALGVLMSKPDRTLLLLDAIEDKRVPSGLLGLPRKTQLLASTNAQVRSRAEAVLGQVDIARSEVVKRYLQSMPQSGDSQRGRELFQKHCANCHRAAGIGVEIGPHMETVRNWDREKLLTNILDPSRELAPQSMSYSIVLSSGQVISGMIAEETASSLVIKRAGVPSETLLREDVEAMTNTGLSLMPAGFEENLTVEQMADLIEFLNLKTDAR